MSKLLERFHNYFASDRPKKDMKQIGCFVEPERYSPQIGILMRRLMRAIAAYGKARSKLKQPIIIKDESISLTARRWSYSTDLGSDNMVKGSLLWQGGLIFEFNVFPNDKEGWCLKSFFDMNSIEELAKATKIIESHVVINKNKITDIRSNLDKRVVRALEK